MSEEQMDAIVISLSLLVTAVHRLGSGDAIALDIMDQIKRLELSETYQGREEA